MAPRPVLIALGVQAGWFACVLGGAHGRPWLGPAVVAVLVVLRLAFETAASRRALVLTAGGAALAGMILDAVLVAAGVLRFPDGAPGFPIPVWMVALWINFALALEWLRRWLGGRWGTAALLGTVGGPASYVAGAELGAVTLGPTTGIAVGAIAAEWTLAMPLLLFVAGAAAGQPGDGRTDGSPGVPVRSRGR